MCHNGAKWRCFTPPLQARIQMQPHFTRRGAPPADRPVPITNKGLIMDASRISNQLSGQAARLEEEIAGQKVLVRQLMHTTKAPASAAAQIRLARLESLLKALRLHLA
jgi:hypothetical protein